MPLTLRDNLPFTTITVIYQGTTMDIPQVLVDTGPAITLLASDIAATIGIVPLPQDILHTLRGVGGTEVVFTHCLDALQVGERSLTNFDIEVGGMDYGFAMHGILGMDFLTRAGAIINLREMTIAFAIDAERTQAG
jgi:predicted aspartyl protease